MLIYGNSYLIAQSFSQSTGFPTAAFVPPVDQVTISEYYAPGEGIKARIDYQGTALYPPVTALHFAGESRPGYLKGRSAIEEIGGTLNTGLALRQFTRQLMERCGMPHLWAKLPDGSTKEQAESVKATLKTLLENRERTIPVSSDIELKPIQINPVDIELLAIKDDIDREICRYFGVLPHLVGVKMESGKTYSNVSAWKTGI